MSSFAKISIRFAADLKGFSTEMQNVQRSMASVGKQMQKVGSIMTIGLTAPLTALGVQGVNTFANFEQALAKVASVSGATSGEMKSLRKNAEDLGASTRFAASDVAALQLSLSKLGFKPGEILQATEGILSLALATGEDLAQSATVAASTIRGFGLDVSETQRVVDVMASSFSSSALDLGKFETAMAVLAPVAQVAGQSIEQATGKLAILVNAGIDASTAGTGLRNIFLDIANQGITLDQALNKINTSTNKNKTSMELFGKRGATVATVLAQNIDAANDFTTVFDNAAGSAKRMADIMDDTLEGSFYKVKSAVESAMIAIGEEMAPTIRRLADSISNVVSKFKDLDSSTKKIIIIVAALGAAIGPVLVGLGLLMTTVIPGLTTAFVALNAVLLANPWTIIAVAIGLAVGAMTLFGAKTEELKATQSILTHISKEATAAIAEEKAKVEQLLWVARDENVSKAQRIKSIKELNQISPTYLGNLNLETINTQNAKDAVLEYNTAMLESARVKSAQAKLIEIQSQMINRELELSARRKAIADAEANSLQGASDNASAAAAQTALLANAKNLLALETANGNKELEAQQQLLLDIIKNGPDAFVSPKVTEIDASGILKETLPELELRLSTEDAQREFQGINELITRMGGNIDEALQTAGMDAFDGKLQDISDTWKNIGDIPNPFTNIEIAAQEFNKGLTSIMASTVANFATGFGELVSSAMNGSLTLGGVFNMILNTLGDLAIQVGQMAIGIGVAVIGIKKALQSLAGPVAIAAGIALVALGTFAKSALANLGGGGSGGGMQVPALASGGIAYGPTLAYVGEYAGASANPEVIAPLDKLKAMIADTVGNGGGGDVNVTGELRLKNNELVAALRRGDAFNKRRR